MQILNKKIVLINAEVMNIQIILHINVLNVLITVNLVNKNQQFYIVQGAAINLII